MVILRLKFLDLLDLLDLLKLFFQNVLDCLFWHLHQPKCYYQQYTNKNKTMWKLLQIIHMRVAIQIRPRPLHLYLMQIKTTFSLNLEIQTDILERAFILSHWKKCIYTTWTNTYYRQRYEYWKIWYRVLSTTGSARRNRLGETDTKRISKLSFTYYQSQ